MEVKKILISYISCSRDYTNPYLPVAQSAIEGGGQVNVLTVLF